MNSLRDDFKWNTLYTYIYVSTTHFHLRIIDGTTARLHFCHSWILNCLDSFSQQGVFLKSSFSFFFFFNIFLSSLSILYDTWEIRNSVYSTFFILFGIEFLCMHRTNDTTQFQVTRRSHGHPYCRANNNNKLTIATCNLRIIRRG